MLVNLARIPGYRFLALYSTNFINDSKFYKNFTFIQFQRSATSTHYEIFKHFYNNIRKQTKTPLIYEIDDLLTDIPEWNYAHEYYKNNYIFIQEMMKMCDGIIVSTEKLREVYSKHNSRIKIIPNHLPKFLWGKPNTERNGFYERQEMKQEEKKPRILYAGSENHFTPQKYYDKGIRGGDFSNKLIDFIRKTIKEYQWVIVGGCPIELNDLKSNGIEYHGWQDILHYPQFIKNLNIDICIAPLIDNIFNSSKSNIKMLEFIAMGCPGVFSKVEPYKNSYLASKDDDEFIGNIENLVKDLDLRKKTYKHDYELVKDQLFWEENSNLEKYINTYLSFFKKRLL
jgi:glycosyltransferase involved in cell wall biosynthesis